MVNGETVTSEALQGTTQSIRNIWLSYLLFSLCKGKVCKQKLLLLVKKKPSMVQLVYVCECFEFGCVQFCYKYVIHFEVVLFCLFVHLFIHLFLCHAEAVDTNLLTVNLATTLQEYT